MAVEKGDLSAMFALALLYEDKIHDYPKAEQYYLMAVEKGDSNAMYALALLYKNEYKDYPKAEQYYLMAVKKDNSNAMYSLALLYEDKFKDYPKAEQYYLMAVEKGDSDAMYRLALIYFQQKKNKEISYELIEKANKETTNKLALYYKIKILLWNNEIEGAIKQFNKMLLNEEVLDNNIYLAQDCLHMFLAKKQFNYVYKLFLENRYEIKERLKPLYYVLMSYMQDRFPDEIKKMGDELKETVKEIIDEINQLEKDYA
jgi:TPR repeat protein